MNNDVKSINAQIEDKIEIALQVITDQFRYDPEGARCVAEAIRNLTLALDVMLEIEDRKEKKR